MVVAFIDLLIKKRNEYLDTRYGQPSKMLAYAPQLENFNWLVNARVINQQQYDEKVKLLNEFFNVNQHANKIGFSKNN